MSSPMKVCIKCGTEKKVAEFSAQKRNSDGVAGECKACRCRTRVSNSSYLRERLRKYQIRSNEGRVSITIEQLEGLLKQPDCTYCGCELTSENKVVDHIYALNGYGGANLLINLSIVCRSCNSSKSNHHIYDFYRRSEKFTDELWTAFVRKYAERMFKRELTDEQVEIMKINFAEEARQLAANA